MEGVPSPPPPPAPQELWALYAAYDRGAALQACAPPFAPPRAAQPVLTEAAGAEPAVSSSSSDGSCSDSGLGDGPVVLFSRAPPEQALPREVPVAPAPAPNRESSSSSDDESSDSEAGDGTAAMAVNNAWINMFVASEMKRREKETKRKEEETAKARRPIERADAKRRQQMEAIYGETATHEILCLESRLDASYSRRVKGKAPVWPCTPLNFMEHQLVSKLLDIDPVVIQKKKLPDVGDVSWPGAKRQKA
eukprot:TRINITY_DN11768_c0_g1_i1.p1 TRINITY_DN11768_c0_g1~~TRINITY_DN11768_c0_g1_i1.p1  ORF type:complete len:250 (+),score=68.41 TRINITY_DN11768_c0_g1_i1:65-814(+)